MIRQSRSPRWPFVLTNAAVWVAMVVVLVVVPDTLERWIPLEIGRVLGWAVAGVIWVMAVEREWKARVGPFGRFGLQLVLWVTAALVAIWISDQARID
jgi:hypothetical protein